MALVAIIGAGDVAGAAAWALASQESVQRVLLVDTAAGVAAGKALDIQQSGAIQGFHTRLHGTDDLSRAAGAAVCVIADRAAAGEWQGDDGLALLRRLLPHVDAPLIFAGPSQAALIAAASRELHVPRRRLAGSAPEAYASALRAVVAMEAGCSAGEVALTVLGTPMGFVVPWSEVTIGGLTLERVLAPVQVTRLEARAPHLWPPGPFALGMAAARAAEAVVSTARRSMSLLTVLDGEFGVRGRVGALPTLLDGSGVARVHTPVLSTRERVQLQTALEA
jgi:malate dehydrogenase